MATQNNTSNFVRLKGKTVFRKMLFVASVAAEEGSIVYPNGSWSLTISDWTAWNFLWVIRQTIATTDSDYASTKMVTVEIPVEAWAEWLFTVWTWTFTAADVWNVCALHTDWKSLAVDTATVGQFVITWYISATRWRASFNPTKFLPATT